MITLHKYYYVRHISGYKTTDSGSVFIYPDGTVGLARFSNTDSFSKLAIPDINQESLDKKFAGDIIVNNDTEVSYEIVDRILTVRDGKLFMRYEYTYGTDAPHMERILIEVT